MGVAQKLGVTQKLSMSVFGSSVPKSDKIQYIGPTIFPVVNTFQRHSLHSKICCIGGSEGLSFFQQSLMAFFTRISKLF